MPELENYLDSIREIYPDLETRRPVIFSALQDEEKKFQDTLERGWKKAQKLIEDTASAGITQISGAEAFNLYETDGFPLENRCSSRGKRGPVRSCLRA